MNGHDEYCTMKLLPEKLKRNIRRLKSLLLHSGGLLPEIFFLKTLLKYGMDWDMQARGETSIAYYLFPDWCEPEYATCIVPNLPSEVEIKWDFSELTDTAQTGDATKGTAEKGKKMNDVNR